MEITEYESNYIYEAWKLVHKTDLNNDGFHGALNYLHCSSNENESVPPNINSLIENLRELNKEG